MKGIFITLIVTLALSISVKSQELKYGVMAGICFPKIILNDISEISGYSANGSSITTYHFNGFIGYKSDSWWEICIEPGFVVKGGFIYFQYNTTSGRINYSEEKKYSNFELPILLNIYLNEKFYLSTGLGLDNTISNKGYQSIAVSIPNLNLLPDMVGKFNYSAIIGLNYKFTDTYAVSIRYNFGLTKLTTVDLLEAASYPYEHKPTLTYIYNDCLKITLKYTIK